MKVSGVKLLAACNLLFKSEYTQYPVLVFVYKTDYPVLFFSILLQRLFSTPEITCHYASAYLNDYAAVQAQITTTFLGQEHTLWFGNINGLDAAEKTKLLQVFGSYKGPHRLVIACAEADLPKSFPVHACIFIDQETGLEDKNKLVQFLYPTLSYDAVKKMVGDLPLKFLDQHVLLAHYAMVLGRNIQAFVAQDWLAKIIVPESSLFLLAQYFFARKKTEFWKLWNSVKTEYPATFWTVFWSEQVWRAYYVVLAQQQNNVLEARAMAFRLPFSFLQKDYKTVTLQELSAVHTMIYEIEWRIKNGASEGHFELVFHRFLLRKI